MDPEAKAGGREVEHPRTGTCRPSEGLTAGTVLTEGDLARGWSVQRAPALQGFASLDCSYVASAKLFYPLVYSVGGQFAGYAPEGGLRGPSRAFYGRTSFCCAVKEMNRRRWRCAPVQSDSS